MNILTPLQVLAASLGEDALDVADVFSTDTYTGNGSSQSITNGLDLSGEGGATWIKSRSAAGDHALFDTARGATKSLRSNDTSAENTDANSLTSFNSDGFSLGSSSDVNFSSRTFVGWSFRKAPKFFDVVTYTGDGVGVTNLRSHNLGVEPGMILIKRTDGADDWYVYHRSLGESYLLKLNLTNAQAGPGSYWDVSASNFGFFVDTSPREYVAYLFAHDTSDSGIIQCGSYTGNGSSTGPTITLGWEPQFLLVKLASSGSENWIMLDSVRDGTNPRGVHLNANTSAAEAGSGPDIDFLSTGFQPKTISVEVNSSGDTYVYMAIRAEGA